MKSILQKIFKNTPITKELSGGISSFFSRIFAAIFGLIFTAILARKYGPEIQGTYALFLSFLTILAPIALFGTQISSLRLLPEHSVKNGNSAAYTLTIKLILFSLFSGLITSIVIFLFADELSMFFFSDLKNSVYFNGVALLFTLFILKELYLVVFRSLEEIKIFIILQGIPNFLLVLALCLGIYLSNSTHVPFLVFAIVTATLFIIGCILLFRYFYKIKPRFENSLVRLKEIIKISLPMMVSNFFLISILKIDLLMIGYFHSESQVGIYSIVMNLIFLTSLITSTLYSFVFPNISSLYYAEKKNEMVSMIQNMTKTVFWINIPIFLIIILAGKLILSIFGSEYIAGYSVLLMLCLGQFFQTFSGPLGMLNMTGHHKAFNKIVILGGLINISLNLLLIPKYEILGAAIASSVSIVSWRFIAIIYIKKKFGFVISYIPFLKSGHYQKS